MTIYSSAAAEDSAVVVASECFVDEVIATNVSAERTLPAHLRLGDLAGGHHSAHRLHCNPSGDHRELGPTQHGRSGHRFRQWHRSVPQLDGCDQDRDGRLRRRLQRTLPGQVVHDTTPLRHPPFVLRIPAEEEEERVVGTPHWTGPSLTSFSGGTSMTTARSTLRATTL